VSGNERLQFLFKANRGIFCLLIMRLLAENTIFRATLPGWADRPGDEGFEAYLPANHKVRQSFPFATRQGIGDGTAVV